MPAKLLDIAEERRIDTQRRELLEEQCPLTIVFENLRREVFQPTITVDESGSGFRSTARNSRIAIRGVTHQGQVVRYVRWLDTELGANCIRIPNVAAFPIHLNDTLSDNTLRKVLVGGPDAYLLYFLILFITVSCGS